MTEGTDAALLAAVAEGAKWACSDISKLPQFPGECGRPAEMMRAAYCWASFMIYYHGPALAPYHAQRCLMTAIDEGCVQNQMGWAAIIQALADLAREPGPDETVH